MLCILPFYLKLINQPSLTSSQQLRACTSPQCRKAGVPVGPGDRALLARPLSGLRQLCFESVALP